MAKIKTIEAMVRDALVHDAKARDDDRILTLDVWVNCYKVNPYAPIKEVMRDKTLPSQETIGRARRKIQEKEEELRGTKQKEKIRLERQEEFINYALELDA